MENVMSFYLWLNVYFRVCFLFSVLWKSQMYLWGHCPIHQVFNMSHALGHVNMCMEYRTQVFPKPFYVRETPLPECFLLAEVFPTQKVAGKTFSTHVVLIVVNTQCVPRVEYLANGGSAPIGMINFSVILYWIQSFSWFPSSGLGFIILVLESTICCCFIWDLLNHLSCCMDNDKSSCNHAVK